LPDSRRFIGPGGEWKGFLLNIVGEKQHNIIDKGAEALAEDEKTLVALAGYKNIKKTGKQRLRL